MKEDSVCKGMFDRAKKEEVISVPPTVQLPDDVMFPFCITRGEDLEDILEPSKIATDSKNTTAQIRWYLDQVVKKVRKNMETANIKCQQVVQNGKHNTV